MKNDKCPGNDEIQKRSMNSFGILKIHYLIRKKKFISGELPTFQKQALIKLIEKKDKWLIKNWCPIRV